MKTFHVYIMASKTGTLYVGLTSNIKKRVWEHKNHVVPGFSDRYKTDRLLYYETIGDSLSAIGREKQIKNWRREKKIKLVESVNPQWVDLAYDWYDQSKELRSARFARNDVLYTVNRLLIVDYFRILSHLRRWRS